MMEKSLEPVVIDMGVEPSKVSWRVPVLMMLTGTTTGCPTGMLPNIWVSVVVSVFFPCAGCRRNTVPEAPDVF